MKMVIIREITSLILRPTISTPATAAPPTQNTRIQFNEDGSTPKSKPKLKQQADSTSKKHVNEHARYYATITLNQIMFLPNEKDVALQVIDMYFRLFEDILGDKKSTDDNDDARSEASQPNKKSKSKRKGKEVTGEGVFTEVEDANSKLVSAILTGVNRALPFAKLSAEDDRYTSTVTLSPVFTDTSKSEQAHRHAVLHLSQIDVQHLSPSPCSHPTYMRHPH